MATIADLETVGYRVGVAFGSVAVEEEALAAAREDGHPDLVAERVSTVTADTVRTLETLGRLPETVEERRELATQIADQALTLLAEAATATIAFHERALDIARTMPDVWRVEQVIEGDPEIVVLSLLVATDAAGHGIDDDAVATLETLADPADYAERDYRARNPEAEATALAIAAAGVPVERPTLGADEWEIEGATLTAAGLAAKLDEIRKRPRALTRLERLAKALIASASLDAATKTRIRQEIDDGGTE